MGTDPVPRFACDRYDLKRRNRLLEQENERGDVPACEHSRQTRRSGTGDSVKSSRKR